MIEVREIGRRHTAAAARVITDALIDDPGWLAVGPDHRAHRHAVALRYHRAALASPTATAGRSTARSAHGRLAGVAATFAAGLYPPPAWTLAKFVPGFLLAGPAPIVRGLRFSSIQDTGTPRGGARLPLVSGRRPRAAAEGCGPRPPRARVRGRGRARLPRHEQPGQRPLLRELRLRGDRARAAPARRRHPVVHEASLRRCASGSPSSFFNVLFSIWRMRSRVTPKARPTSSSVRAFPPASP